MPSLYHCQNKSSTNKKQGNWTKRNFLLNSFRLWIFLLYLSGLLDDQIDHIVEEFELVWTNHGSGHNGHIHNGTARSCTVPFINQSKYLSRLIDDIFASLLGDDYNYLGSDGTYYVGDTGWHSNGGWLRPIAYYNITLSRCTDTGYRSHSNYSP